MKYGTGYSVFPVENHVFNYIQYKGDSEYIWEKNQKSWKGPVKVIAHRGRDVFVMLNENIKKIVNCNVQPYEKKEIEYNENTEEDVEIQEAEKK